MVKAATPTPAATQETPYERDMRLQREREAVKRAKEAARHARLCAWATGVLAEAPAALAEADVQRQREALPAALITPDGPAAYARLIEAHVRATVLRRRVAAAEALSRGFTPNAAPLPSLPAYADALASAYAEHRKRLTREGNEGVDAEIRAVLADPEA